MKQAITDKQIKYIWLTMLALAWELITRSGLVSTMLLPPLSEVILGLGRALFETNLLLSYLQSMAMILLGLIISQSLVLLMVYLGYNYRSFGNLFDLLASILHPLPGLALLPVIMIWFGIGKESVMVVLIHAALWPMYLSLKKGFDEIDSALIEAAHNNGASKWQLYRYVLLTCSFRDSMTGLKIGFARSWRGLISAEMIFGAISAIGGIGWYMFERRVFMDTVGTYSAIVLVVITGIVVESLVFNRLLDQWYKPE